MRDSRVELLGGGGALLILAGAHAPFVHVELAGDWSFQDLAESMAVGVQLAAVGALVLLLLARTTWLWVPAAAAWLALAWPFLSRLFEPAEEATVFTRLRDAVSDAAVEAYGDQAFDLFDEAVSIRWGLPALLAGCVLLGVAALRALRARS